MFEVRPFGGTPEELSDFIVSAWRSTYAGKMSVPHWSGDYFRWQLRLDEPDSAKRMVAVYKDEVPVGAVLYFPATFEIAGRRIEAAQASWLSVPREYRGQGIGRMLNDAAGAWQREAGLRFRVGYGYTGSRASLGPKFWKNVQGQTSVVPRRVGFWARVLDPLRAAAWNVNRWEGLSAKIAGPLLRLPRLRHPPGVVVREVRPDDLPRCLELAEQATAHCDFRLVWDEDRLARQLGLKGFSEALVAEVDGELLGCVGYHILPVEGRTVENVGVLDLLFVSELSAATRRELLNAALLKMHEAGAVVALKLRTGDYPPGTFLNWGWVWKRPDSDVIVTWSGDPEPLPPLKTLHVLWR